MCGVRKLTRTAYANQRMTLHVKLRQRFKAKAEYDDRATWGNPRISAERSSPTKSVARAVRVFIIHVLFWAFADASVRRGRLGALHFFFAAILAESVA